ncbi:MAG: hypothetical protein NT051_00860, partial [Candidatus Micrarchaeota archaeon]|nr:hypothetical protein [Candidatus Micrarchaeota archaeon]
QGGTGAQNGAQNPLAPIISELPPAVQEAAAPALGLMVIGGGALAVAAGLVAYYFIAKRRKPRKPA